MACLLILLGLCHPTPTQLTLGAFQATSNFVDTYATMRNFAPRPGLYGVEFNPIQRPFVTHGPAIAYAAATGESIAFAYLGYRLKRSHSWIRHLWWVPQTFNALEHIEGAKFSFNNYHN